MLQRIEASASFGGAAAQASLELVRTRFVRSVYQWMAGGLALTAATALLVVRSPALLTALVFNRGAFLVLALVELGLVVWLSAGIHRMSVRTASWAFLVYSVLNGATLSTIFVLYAGTLVWIGWDMAWASIQQGETTGTPWNPPIWPVKLAIPVAGLLLLLQGIANLLRDLGIATPRAPE